MIKRLWHGWTEPDKADTYERLLREEVFPGIAAKAGDGFLGAELLRRDGEDECEFLTLLSFRSLATIEALVGEDVTLAYLPPVAKSQLSRWEERARHYEVRTPRSRG